MHKYGTAFLDSGTLGHRCTAIRLCFVCAACAETEDRAVLWITVLILAVTRECALKLYGKHNMFKRAVGDSVNAPDKVCS